MYRISTHLLRQASGLVIATALCLGYAGRAAAQTQLSHYQPGVTTEGAVYYLPKTAAQVRVLVEKTTYRPGDFARYAPRYLRVNNVALEPSVAYRVVEIDVDAIPVPDTTKVFAVKFNAKTVAANVTLADDGRLLAINDPEAGEAAPRSPFTPAQKGRRPDPKQFLSAEILACGSKAKMAELTANEIYDLRENRTLLIKGQADFMPQDGTQMQIMLRQLDEQERALSSLFIGTTDVDTTEHVLNVVPQEPLSRQTLFRLSQQQGLTDADGLSGEPFYISVDDLQAVPTPQADQGKGRKRQNEAGIYVNVPGRMRITIERGTETLCTATLPAPQFGNVELLSGELFNKRYTTRLRLSPLTGAVEQLQADPPK
ncbi:MAG: DUF4831 family protein [Prevotella sp.]|nr:DUF4831 family protein [Prevotella sp.]